MPRSSISRYFNAGPDIDPAASQALQAAVADKLMRQTENAVLNYVTTSADPGITLAALQALFDLPPERRTGVLQHPAFRYWLQVMRRTSAGEHGEIRDTFAQRIVDFVWPQQLAAGSLDRTWPAVTDELGGLRCAPFGRYIELGAAYRNQLVKISPRSENAVIRCADGLEIQVPPEDLVHAVTDPPTVEAHGYTLTMSSRAADGRVEVSNRDPWLRVRLTGTNQRTDGTEFLGVNNDLYPASFSADEIDGALALLRRYWPKAHDDLAEFTRVIVPIVAPGASVPPRDNSSAPTNERHHAHIAFTVSSRQGAIYIGPAPPDASVEMILHENAHVKLRQLQAVDSLLCDPLDETVKIPVPWRPDPRPIPGILEGLFVFCHVAEFESQRYRADPGAVTMNQVKKRLEGLSYAVDCLDRHAKLTAEGAEFLAMCKRWVSDLRCRVPGF